MGFIWSWPFDKHQVYKTTQYEIKLYVGFSALFRPICLVSHSKDLNEL